MIKIQNMSFTYPSAKKPILKNINLEINEGEFVALIGNNGCGKSTLCKTLNGLIPHFTVGNMDGKVLIDEIDTTKVKINQLAKKIGYVYQDFENQIIMPIVKEEASYSCLNYGFEDYEEKGIEALEICGLIEKKDNYIWELSGGQKHLLALAGVLALSPKIIILDEPIAQLDPFHAKEIYECLKKLNEVYNKTIIVIEHSTEFIAEYCKEVILLKDGTVKWKLPTKEALIRVDELEESNIFPPQVTIAANNLLKNKMSDDENFPINISDGISYFNKLNYKKEIELVSEEKEKKDEKILSFDNVSLKYRAVKGEAKYILNDFSLTLNKNEKIALIGANGAGKSTLMKLLIGLIKPTKGNIYFEDKNIKDVSPELRSDIISLVLQNPEEMFIKDSIKNDIMYTMKERGIQDYLEKTNSLLKRFRLSEYQDKDGRLLSGGQMRRASLAIGIALNPEILLLDEPTANLDIATRKEILKTLQDIKEITKTVMIATHDMQLVCDWAERVIVLFQGEILADGTVEEIFKNDIVRKLVGIIPPQIERMAETLNFDENCFTIEQFLIHFGGYNEQIN